MEQDEVVQDLVADDGARLRQCRGMRSPFFASHPRKSRRSRFNERDNSTSRAIVKSSLKSCMNWSRRLRAEVYNKLSNPTRAIAVPILPASQRLDRRVSRVAQVPDTRHPQSG